MEVGTESQFRIQRKRVGVLYGVVRLATLVFWCFGGSVSIRHVVVSVGFTFHGASFRDPTDSENEKLTSGYKHTEMTSLFRVCFSCSPVHQRSVSMECNNYPDSE